MYVFISRKPWLDGAWGRNGVFPLWGEKECRRAEPHVFSEDARAPKVYWVVVKELKLNCDDSEIISSTVYPHCGNLY